MTEIQSARALAEKGASIEADYRRGKITTAERLKQLNEFAALIEAFAPLPLFAKGPAPSSEKALREALRRIRDYENEYPLAIVSWSKLYRDVEKIATDALLSSSPAPEGKREEQSYPGPESKVIEEIGEVLQAIGKVERFGLFNYHPERPESNNRDELLAEIDDLKTALDQYEMELRKETP